MIPSERIIGIGGRERCWLCKWMCGANGNVGSVGVKLCEMGKMGLYVRMG